MANTKKVNKPKREQHNYLFEGRILRLSLSPNGYEIVDHDDAVAIVAEQNGKVLFVQQYRHAVDALSTEIPAGLIDPGETPEQAALRELSEETQLTGDLEFLCSFYVSPGFCNEKLYVFKASNLSPKAGTPDDDENIEVLWLDPKEVLQRANSGELTISASTIMGIMHAGLN